MKIMKKIKKYLESDVLNSESKVKIVRKIIKEVKKGGDKSLINFTNKYDKNNFKNIKEMEVSNNELTKSINFCTKEFLQSTKLAIKRIKSYQKITPKKLTLQR